MTDINLLEMFEEIANKKKHEYVVFSVDEKANVTEKITYEKLQSAAKALACYFVKHYNVGDRVLVMTTHSVEYYIAMFGCFYAGLTVVPIAPPSPANLEFELSQIKKIFNSSGAKCMLITRNVQHYLDIVGARESSDRSIKSRIIKFFIKSRIKKVFLHFGMDQIKPVKIIDELPPIVYIEDLIKTDSTAWKKPLIDDKTLAFILYTSGSTGMPKGVMVTQTALAYNIVMMAQLIAPKDGDGVCCWLPITTIAGIMGRLIAAVTGHLTVVFSAFHFIQNPILWLQVISKYKLTISLAPCFAYTLCCRLATKDAIKKLDLSSLRIAVSGGEIVRKDTLEQFSQMFAPSGFDYKAFYPYYGLTETLCTTTTPHGDAAHCVISGQGVQEGVVSRTMRSEDDGMIFVSNGKPLAHIVLRIVDPHTFTELPADKIGEIWIKSSTNTLGYWQNPEATNAAVNNYIAGTKEGPFFRTGDLGFNEGDNLYITGRLKELIIIHGKNYYPDYIEGVVTEQLAAEGITVSNCTAFAVEIYSEEGLALIIEQQEGHTLEERQALTLKIRKLVTDFIGIAVADVAYTSTALPRTRTNKVMRLLCKSQYENGAFGAPVEGINKSSKGAANRFVFPQDKPSTAEEIKKNVLQWIERNVTEKAIDPESLIENYSFDSITSVRFIAELSSWLSAPLSPALLHEQFSISTLSDYLMERLTSQAEGLPHALYKGFLDLEKEVWYEPPRIEQVKPDKRRKPKNIFLTGATGFLGAYLLSDLLKETKATVFCLVRAEHEADGLARILDNLDYYFLVPEDTSRIKPILGDLDKPKLGLTADVVHQLAEDIDVIYHSAALVNFVVPYEQLKPSNVSALHDVLDIAMTHHAKHVHYISTVAIFDSINCLETEQISEHDALPPGDTIFGGYAQSKWVAEQTMQLAIKKGVPGTIYRPGIITGDSRNGAWRLGDAASRFIKHTLEIGKAPAFDESRVFDMVPVDYVSKAIVSLSIKANTVGEIYHVTNPHPVSVSKMIDECNKKGYEVESIPYVDYEQTMKESIGKDMNHVLYPLLPLFQEQITPEQTMFEVLVQRPEFECSNTLSQLEKTEVTCPPVTELIDVYLDYFAEKGWDGKG